jgi:hypothetical protein
MTTIKWVMVVMFLSVLLAGSVWGPKVNQEPPAQTESSVPDSSDLCCKTQMSCCEIGTGG